MQNLVHIIIWARLGMAFEFVSSKYIFVDIAVQHLSITGLIDILWSYSFTLFFFVHLEDSSEKQLKCFYCAGANIDPDLLLAVFLPALLFESSFSMEVHQIKVPFLTHTFFICYSLTFYRVKGYIPPPPPSQHQPQPPWTFTTYIFRWPHKIGFVLLAQWRHQIKVDINPVSETNVW